MLVLNGFNPYPGGRNDRGARRVGLGAEAPERIPARLTGLPKQDINPKQRKLNTNYLYTEYRARELRRGSLGGPRFQADCRRTQRRYVRS